MEKWGPVLEQVNLPVEDILENLINADYVLRNGTNAQKQQLLNQIVNDYAINLEEETSPQIAQLTNAKNEDGSPKYPHFESVRERMSVLVSNGLVGGGDLQTQMENAYKEALWMNTETRERLLSEQQSRAQEETQKRQKRSRL